MTETVASESLRNYTEEPDTTQLVAEGQLVVSQAREIVVDSAETWANAGEFLRSIKTVRQRIKETFDEPISRAHAAHKSMIRARDQHDSPLKSAEVVVKTRMGAYKAEEARQRAAKEARLRAEAQKQAEELRLAEAERLEAQGRPEQAEAVIAAPVIAAPVVLPSQAPKTEGVSTRKVWKFRIPDPLLVPREWCSPAEKAIGAYVRTQGEGAIGMIPGVEVYSEDSVAVKGY